MSAAELFSEVKSDLIRSNADRRHPYRKVILSTQSDYPESRYVIKRKTDQDLLTIIYTDSRSPKIDQITNNRNVTLLFYHDKKNIQIRMYGQCTIVSAGEEYDHHKAIAENNPQDYLSSRPPGTSMSEADISVSNHMHFCVLKFEPVKMDILRLSRNGHTRASYLFDGKNWDDGELLVP